VQPVSGLRQCMLSAASGHPVGTLSPNGHVVTQSAHGHPKWACEAHIQQCLSKKALPLHSCFHVWCVEWPHHHSVAKDLPGHT
jgi:hypothetical protein